MALRPSSREYSSVGMKSISPLNENSRSFLSHFEISQKPHEARFDLAGRDHLFLTNSLRLRLCICGFICPSLLAEYDPAYGKST
jgi:hypothetical protein